MRPLLEVLSDDDDHSIRSIRQDLAAHFSLTDADIEERIPSGRVTTFQNRVGWAATYLFQAGLIDRPRRAVYRMAPRGYEVFNANPERVDLAVLSQFEQFEEFRNKRNDETPKAGSVETADDQTPEERIQTAHKELQSALSDQLLERIQEQSASFFEQLVLDVLRAMGYGGLREQDSERLGRTGDAGVDGVIREDRLGLDTIYIQAKKWSDTVGRPEIQKFVGALQGQQATKGVFLSTSPFSSDAVEYAARVTPRVILVDGDQLAQLMIEHDVGVTTSDSYQLKRLDLGYFEVEDGPTEESPTPSPLPRSPA